MFSLECRLPPWEPSAQAVRRREALAVHHVRDVRSQVVSVQMHAFEHFGSWLHVTQQLPAVCSTGSVAFCTK
jgi:hypothetical protein